MNNKANNGVIYILTNPSFPEYVKIGYADNLAKRLKELNRSECIPYAFRVYAIYEVTERLQDIAIHSMIDSINPTLRAIETFDGKQRKKEFYAMSADDAYAILETIAKISGTTERLKKLTPEGHEIVDEKIAEAVENETVYTEESHFDCVSSEIKSLFSKYKDEISKLGYYTVEPRKLYIAFKSGRNFSDFEIHRSTIKIYLNMKIGTLDDPKQIAEDVSHKGHWGNGDYRITVADNTDFDYIVSLIGQSYRLNCTCDHE